MYVNSENKIVMENDPYTDAEGKKYPRNFPKSQIPDLVKVTESEKPAGIVTGFEVVDGVQVWQTRAPDTDEVKRALKAYRDDWWRAQTVTLTNGAVMKVDDRTRRDTADTEKAMTLAGMNEYAGWNAEDGTYTMSPADFQEYAVKALQVVATAFAAYNTAKAGDYDSIEDALAAFDVAVSA